MPWPVKAFEWRKLPGSTTWHFFIKGDSLCGRAKSNGEFDYLDGAPAKSAENVCKRCKKTLDTLKDRFDQV